MKYTRPLAFALLLVPGACAVDSKPPKSVSTDPAVTAVEKTPEPSLPDPEQLRGYDTVSLEKMFGPPTFLRRDPPAQLWQYQTPACVLDFFLYEDGAGVYEVAYLEFRETDKSAGDWKTGERENCLRQILSRKAPPSAPAGTGQVTP